MDNALTHLNKKFLNIRAGKASPSMVSAVMVDYYGTPTPLNQVSNVSTPDGMTISIQPWEKSMTQPIETAIINSNLEETPLETKTYGILYKMPINKFNLFVKNKYGNVKFTNKYNYFLKNIDVIDISLLIQ